MKAAEIVRTFAVGTVSRTWVAAGIAVGILIFIILLALIVLVSRLSRDIHTIKRELSGSPFSVRETRPAAAAPVTNAPVAQNGVSDEVVAVIAAAVAAMAPEGTQYAVRSVRRVNARPVWAAAGLMENTRPF